MMLKRKTMKSAKAEKYRIRIKKPIKTGIIMGYTSCRNQSKIEIKSIKISCESKAMKFDFERF